MYDTTKIACAKQKLRLTNLYSKVDILALPLSDGVHLYVVLREVFYLNPDGIGGSLESRRYGNENDWYRLSLGLTRNNFRGMMETFSIAGSVWDDRGLFASWTKPLYPSLYYFGLGGGILRYPDLNFPQNRLIVYGKASVGRRLTLHSQGGVGLAPMYTLISALDGSAITKFREIIASLRWQVDFRNDTYDPVHGWNLVAILSSNAAFSDDARKYGQLNTNGRWYMHGFFKSDRFALHTQTVFRTANAGDFKRLYLGGDGSVRGFPTSWLGLTDTMNNYAAISSEYRFHLYTTHIFDFSSLTGHIEELRGLYYEIDGALIANAGHLWHEALKPLDRRQNGAGIGLGLNIKVPTLRITGCIDAVWPITKEINPASAYFNRTVLYSVPTWHVFLNSF